MLIIWQYLLATQPDVLIRLVGRGLWMIPHGVQVQVRLGDSAERLMRHRGYRRIKGKVRQVSGE